ncbi:MAG: hypothetical protein HYX65_02060 [Gemmatimonadetes bacterium]|nr:hypothetical protein [Gemmatimonadota bacterium]
MTRRRLRLGALVALVAAVTLSGIARAVLVSPLAIFMDTRTRTAEVMLANTSTATEEVTVDLRYGYSTTDTNESPMVPSFAPESLSAEAPSAARFIRVFPRRVVLAPGQSQTVRLFASPTPALPDGEYWARFLATAKRLPDTTKAGEGTQVGVSFAIVTSIPLWYRKGAVTTSISMDTLTAVAAGDTLRARAVLSRGGNASWLGTATFALLDARQRPVREWTVAMSIYQKSYRRRLAWPLEKLAAGTYTLVATLSPVRTDLRTADVLPAPEARARTQVTVP